jgi:hypothetical protein
MDVGVGSFVFSQGLSSTTSTPSLRRTIRQAIPVVALGMIRVVMVKGVDYPVRLTTQRKMQRRLRDGEVGTYNGIRSTLEFLLYACCDAAPREPTASDTEWSLCAGPHTATRRWYVPSLSVCDFVTLLIMKRGF